MSAKPREAIFRDLPDVKPEDLVERLSGRYIWQGSACVIRDTNEAKLAEIHEALTVANWVHMHEPKYFSHPTVFEPYSYTGVASQEGAQHGFSLCHRDVRPLTRTPFISAMRQAAGISDVIVAPPTTYDMIDPGSAVDLHILNGKVTSDLHEGLVTSRNMGARVGKATLNAGDMLIIDVRNYHCTFTRKAERLGAAIFYKRPYLWPNQQCAESAESN